MITEYAAYPQFYPGLRLKVDAPEWYFKGHEADNEYSQKILSSKRNDESNYFIPKIKELIDELIKNSELQKIGLVITIPKSDLEYSITLNSIAKWIKTHLNIEYENIIERVAKGRRNLGGNASEKRFNQTIGSMKLKRSLKHNEKNILILDDVKATGMTLLEGAKILKSAGAENIFCICLGINRNWKSFLLKNKQRGVKMELKKEDLVRWLKLSSVKGIGSSRMLKLLSIFGNVNDIYKASTGSLFSTRIFNKSMIDEYEGIKKKDSRYFEYIIDECENHKIKIIPFYSKEYPPKLKAMPDSPLTLFAWGDIELLKTKKVAIVGSRESSEEAKKWTFENTQKISNKGITIVSGGAKGIDYSAHHGALSSNGKTIAIVGSGLFKLYPEEHRELFDEIKHKGLLLSEHPPEYVGSRISLLRRNRIISGISNCLLLVTSSTEGGSVTQLKIANTQRIPIFCPSVSLNLLPNAGIKEAISKYHVTEITNIEPIIKEVNKPGLFSYI